jgi:hypothetical protein
MHRGVVVCCDKYDVWSSQNYSGKNNNGLKSGTANYTTDAWGGALFVN